MTRTPHAMDLIINLHSPDETAILSALKEVES
jgi:hypothetical protein